ncbi:MAG: glycosyltransferase family 9 protein [Armatimonadota bacterium]|nr:glycosyltransferase family 9 protein [Armatimonadota bacterium]MDW8025733.1 glycosyltransferase family 9 protein [Armatimonadota bacterium]
MDFRTLYVLDQKLFGFIASAIGAGVKSRRYGAITTGWKRVAISKYVGMGSLVLATPLLRAIRERLKATVALVTLKQHEELAYMLGFDKCFTLDVSSLTAAIKSSLALILSLRRWSPEAFFELEFFSNAAALIAFLSGAGVRVGFHHAQSPRGRLLTHIVPFTPRHTCQLFLAQAWAVGIETNLNEPLIRPSYQLGKVSENVLKLPRPFVVVNPNAGEMALQRRWLGERFCELILRLLDAYPNMHICVIGAPKEVSYVKSVLAGIEEHERVHNLAGKLNLHELCMLLDEALLVVTNDSGPMHIAAALGTPCIAIFGPESPAHYAPIGAQHRIIYKALPCSPCLNPYDGKMFACPFGIACMRLISVDEVFCEVASLIEGNDTQANTK